MADHGQRAAEEAQAKVARRLKSIYGEAVKDIDKQIKAYTDKYAKADTKMRAKLAEGKITDAQYAAWKRGQVFTGDLWRKKRDMLAGTMYDADVLAQRIINGERLNVFAENMNSMAYDMEHGEGVDMGFGYYDSSTVARLLAEDPDMLPAPRVKKDKDTTWYRSKVNNVVTKGIIMGSSIPDMASEIARETGEMAYKAALRNARTAMTGAQNAGRIEAMEQAQSMGIKVQKRWMSTLDGRTRDAHRDLDGQVQDVDKPFESDLGDIMFPGDPHAHPGNLYNCRCTLVYVHPEYPSSLPRRDQTTGEVIEDMSYREWESWKRGETKEKATRKPAVVFRTLSQGDIKTLFGERPDRALRRTDREEYDRQREAYKQSAFGIWSEGLDADEQSSIADYSSDTYSAINGYCRGQMTENMVRKWDISSKLPIEQEIGYVERAISKFELQGNIKVYRTCERDVLQAIGNTGDAFKDNGFVSTTVFDKSVASGTVDIVIDVPKGVGRGAWIQPLSGSPDEYEFLLQRGSVFEVTKITEANGRTRVEMTWVGVDADEPRYATREQVIERWKRLGLYDEIAAKEI